MQDQVAWDPQFIDRTASWQEKALVLFLLVVCVLAITYFIWFWLRLRSAPIEAREGLASMKRWTKLTLVVTGFLITDWAAREFRAFATEKISVAYVYGALAGIMTEAAMGLFVATVMYGGCMLCEWRIAKASLRDPEQRRG